MQTMLIAAGLSTLGLYVVITAAVAATTLRVARSRPLVGRAWRGNPQVDLREDRAA